MVRQTLFLLLLCTPIALCAPIAAQSGKALSLNGRDAYAWLDHPLPDMDELTIELWSKYTPTSSSSLGIILMDATPVSGNDFVMSRKAESIGIRADKSGGRLSDEGASVNPIGPHLGEGWHHIAWVMEPSRSRIYVDGQLEVEVETSGTNIGYHAQRPTLGRWYDESTRSSGFYRGSIDEFRIWTRARTAEEITGGMTEPPTAGDADLLLYYDFEGVGPGLVDLSGNGRSAELVGGALRVEADDQPPELPPYPDEERTWTNGSLRVDGSGAHAEVPYQRRWSHFGTRFTIEMWVQVDRFAGEEWNFFLSNEEYELGVDTRNARLVTAGHGPWMRGLRHLTTGKWHHVAWVRDGKAMFLVTDGILNSPLGPTEGVIHDRQRPLWIGGDETAPGRSLVGRIDEVRLWEVSRTVEEIAADMHRSSPADVTGLRLHLSFDGELADGRVRDRAGHGLHALLADGALVDTTSGAPVDEQRPDPELSVAPDTIHVAAHPTVSPLRVDAASGVPAWSVAALPPVPWLRAAGFYGDSASGKVEGLGTERLALYTNGRGLPPGRHQALVVVEAEGGERFEVPVVMDRQPDFPPAVPPATDAGQLLQLRSAGAMQVEAPTALGGLTTFTAEFWVKEQSVRLDGQIFAVVDSVSMRMRLSRYDGAWRWRVNDSPFNAPPVGDARFPKPVDPAAFQHVAIVQDGDIVRVYADGVLLGEQVDMRIRWHGPAYRLVVGRDEEDRSYFTGAIDELRFWDVALTTQQIRTRMNTSLTGAEPNLVGYWRFDELADGDRLRDLSGNGQDGRVISFGEVITPLRLAASAAPIGVEPTPELAVRPQSLTFSGAAPEARQLALSNAGAGILRWSVLSQTPWLKLAPDETSTPTDRLDGEGPVQLRVSVSGHGLPAGRHDGTLHIEHSGGVTEVPVILQVSAGPTLGIDEDQVAAGEVPPEAWTLPFAQPPGEALAVDLTAIETELRQGSDVELLNLRVVAVRPDGVVYVAAETPVASTWGKEALSARVWTSADRGATWTELLRVEPRQTCDFSVRLQDAALHPDGSRVFLGTTFGLYLDDQAVPTPPQSAAVTALHVSADGRFLWMATEDLVTLCEWPTYAFSARGVYRASLDDSPMRWADATSPLTRDLGPVSGLGSDPRNPDLLYLRPPAGVVFRKRLLSAASAGWSLVDPVDVPAHVEFAPGLSPAADQLRVQDRYLRGWTPRDIDIKWGWRGLLFGRDGVAWGHYGGSFSHSERDVVIESRDHGVTWAEVYRRWGFGWGSGDLEPFALAVDAHGLVGATGTSMTGVRAESVGPWNTDPVDPLTTYVAMRGRGLAYRTSDSGETWERMGVGLPPTLRVGALALDSLGYLYLRAGTDVYRRHVVARTMQLADVEITPAVLSPGDEVVITARLRPLPDNGLLPDDLEVRVALAPNTASLELCDDGVSPDRAARDGLWTTAATVAQHRPYGHYGAVIWAASDRSPDSRASQRLPYRVVPDDAHQVFGDEMGPGWSCTQATDDPVTDARHAYAGRTAILVEGEVTCAYDGGSLHPFGRTLELMAYSESSTDDLRIMDLPDPVELPAGRWTPLRFSAEGLFANPDPDDTYPCDVSVLTFRSPTPVWLDEIRLTTERPDPIITVIETPSSTLPNTTTLLPAHPNPFNESTVISLHLAGDGEFRVALYNTVGQRLRSLRSGWLAAGTHQLSWDGRDDAGHRLSTGVYIVCLQQAGDLVDTRKVMLLR